MDKPETEISAPRHWQEVLDEADLDVAAGRVVPAAEVHAMLKERRRRDAKVQPDPAR